MYKYGIGDGYLSCDFRKNRLYITKYIGDCDDFHTSYILCGFEVIPKVISWRHSIITDFAETQLMCLLKSCVTHNCKTYRFVKLLNGYIEKHGNKNLMTLCNFIFNRNKFQFAPELLKRNIYNERILKMMACNNMNLYHLINLTQKDKNQVQLLYVQRKTDFSEDADIKYLMTRDKYSTIKYYIESIEHKKIYRYLSIDDKLKWNISDAETGLYLRKMNSSVAELIFILKKITATDIAKLIFMYL